MLSQSSNAKGKKSICFDLNIMEYMHSIEMFHDTPLLRMSDFSILIYNFS